MRSERGSFGRLGVCVVQCGWSGALVLAALLAVAPCLGAQEDAKKTRENFVETIESSPESIGKVLAAYNQIESQGKWDEEERFNLHQALLGALRKVEDEEALSKAARRVFDSSSRSQLPSKVLLLKLMLASNYPEPREARVSRLVELARGRDFRLSIWALRILGDSRWQESVDALIGLLEEEEREGRPTSLLGNVAAAELYRMLGSNARQGSTAGAIRSEWEKSDKKLPKEPDYSPADEGTTVSFFGDVISPQSVFVIDMSTSMRQEATLDASGGRRTSTEEERRRRAREARKEPKVTIVKRELERSLGRLQPHFSFNILSYSATVTPWSRAGGGRLVKAGDRNLESAVEFTRNLSVASGTNIHDSLTAALQVPEVETIYLLSDGVPSVGGDQGQIERRLERLNYLLGVRVITYGFAAEGENQGSFDEEFMKRLAKEGRGWYRRLNP